MSQMRSIVIVGGGFAGTTLARALEGRLPPGTELTLISEESYTTFNPMLPSWRRICSRRSAAARPGHSATARSERWHRSAT